MSCKESFVPAYITRISMHQYKVTDADDVGMIALERDGNEGVSNVPTSSFPQRTT
jgi:hypothetical protein